MKAVQKPRIDIHTPYKTTDGKECIYLTSAYGYVPDKWQELVLNRWLATDNKGAYLHRTCCLSVPRQNGKNGILEMIELYKTLVQGRKILHTAHEVKTCRKAFLRFKEFFEGGKYPELEEEVSSMRSTNGQEAIIFKNGASIEFISRSKRSGRGFTVDDVILDEAQELEDEQMEALISTCASAPSQNAQVFLVGTPPSETAIGDVFRKTRTKAITNQAKRICWLEWSVADTKDIEDIKLWYQTNPALGIRITHEAVEGELATLSTEGFARERLGYWSSQAIDKMFDIDTWNTLKTDSPPMDGKLAYGVKFSYDGKIVCLSACVRAKDRLPYIEVIEHRTTTNGTGWLIEWLYQRKDSAAAIVIDGNASALVEGLSERKVKGVIPPSTATLTKACSMFYELVSAKGLQHMGQPLLDEAIKAARKRKIGNFGAFGFMSEEFDVTPLESCALAYLGAKTSKRNPQKKQRIL